MIKYLILLYFIKTIFGDCFTENPTNVEICKNKKTGDNHCCFVEYRNNKSPNYTTLCVELFKDDVKNGRYEETMFFIELGNYTGSNWSETILEKFRDYSSISIFDCKGNYLYKSLLFFYLIIYFLI